MTLNSKNSLKHSQEALTFFGSICFRSFENIINQHFEKYLYFYHLLSLSFLKFYTFWNNIKDF